VTGSGAGTRLLALLAAALPALAAAAPARAAAVASCRPAGLSLTMQPGARDGAWLLLRNRGPAACRPPSSLRLLALDGAGNVLPAPATTPAVAPSAVLRSGEALRATLRWVPAGASCVEVKGVLLVMNSGGTPPAPDAPRTPLEAHACSGGATPALILSPFAPVRRATGGPIRPL
jgi:hypothetical protein